MAFDFKTIQDEVKRRSTRDQSGTQFDTAIKNIINTSIFTISREALWRQLRRKTTIDTITSYTTGSGGGTFTNDSKSVTITGATFITDDIQPGRRIELQGSSKTFTIKTITGETTLTIDIAYDGTTISGTGTYTILPQEEYNLPINASHRCFIWHEDYNRPSVLGYMTDQDFYRYVNDNTQTGTPSIYRMWSENMVIEQLKEASVITVVSSSSSDTTKNVTVFGTVSGYPDSETISTNSSDGTTSVAGSKSFTSVDRVVCSDSRTGRISVTANSGNSTVAVLPVGDTMDGVLYKKLQLWPLPDAVFPLNIQYYIDPVRLVNDGDVHQLGQEFDELIILLAVSKINFEENKEESGKNFYSLYKDELKSLKRTNTDKPDWFPGLRRPSLGRSAFLAHKNLAYSQAGSFYGPRVR